MRSGSDFYFRKVTQIETYLVECVQKKWCLKSRSTCVVVMETKRGKEHSTPDHVLEGKRIGNFYGGISSFFNASSNDVQIIIVHISYHQESHPIRHQGQVFLLFAVSGLLSLFPSFVLKRLFTLRSLDHLSLSFSSLMLLASSSSSSISKVLAMSLALSVDGCFEGLPWSSRFALK
jgi:hypothetical protein